MRFVPALRLHALTPLYDAVIRGVMPERKFRVQLLSALEVGGGTRVLDVGCGTGSFPALLSRRPDVDVVGLDADARVLARARAKARRGNVEFVRGDATRLPFANGSFDRVATTLMLHHLTTEEKVAMLRECRRVLRPGGKLCILDWDAPRGWRKATFWSVRLIDGLARTQDHARGAIAERAREAGFANVAKAGECSTAFGILGLTTADA